MSLQTNVGSQNNLKRSLKTRHMTMIAIGGAIGTGLFVASGSVIASAGPGSALLAYILISVMVYFVMMSLGEMASLIPITGSFETYASRFIDPALGFSLGWNYWYNWAITIAAELAAGALVMKFWFPNTPAILWSAIFLSIIFAINFLSVRGYGEAEYWFAGIKVVTIIIFLIVGVLIILGILGGHVIGLSNFTKGDAPFVGGFMPILGAFMVAGFAFQGEELVSIAAGESEEPGKNIPIAIKQIFWRILLFYIGSIIIISAIIPYTDPNLLNSTLDNVSISPFALVFQRAGFAFAASVMNAVILTSVLSCGNSGMYAASRFLWAMAKEGRAPKVFAKTNKRGVPVNAIYLTTLVGMAAFLTSLYGDGKVYIWLLDASALAGFIAWAGIAITHYRFRKAYIAQGRNLNDLKYKARWYPFAPIFAFVLCSVVIVGQNYQAFLEGTIDWTGVIVSYIGLPIFLILWFGYKYFKKTKIVPLKECNFSNDI